MPRVPVEKMNAERLMRWEKRLNEFHATPLLMVGYGHDEVKGELFYIATDAVPDLFIIDLLRRAEVKLCKQAGIKSQVRPSD